MNAKLENALTNVETTYGELIEIANGMLKPLFDPINQLVNAINLTINALSIEQIRDYILQLQLNKGSVILFHFSMQLHRLLQQIALI